MLIDAFALVLQTIEVYKKNAVLFLKYMLLLLIPSGLLTIMSTILGPFVNNILAYGINLLIVLDLIVTLLLSVVSLWISIAFIKTIAKCLKNESPAPIKQELISALGMLWPAILVSLLVGIISLGGFILFVVPGLIFSIWFAFAFNVLVLENQKPMESLKTSRDLTLKRWWPVLWRLFVPTFIFGIALVIAQWIVNTPYQFIIKENLANYPSTLLFAAIVFAILNTIVALLFAPLSTIFPIILYYNLKATPNPEPLPMEKV